MLDSYYPGGLESYLTIPGPSKLLFSCGCGVRVRFCVIIIFCALI
jgi:hypothetical protein